MWKVITVSILYTIKITAVLIGRLSIEQHFIDACMQCNIISLVPFCPLPFCPLPFCPLPFCPSHFAPSHFAPSHFAPNHFASTILSIPFCPRTHFTGKLLFCV